MRPQNKYIFRHPLYYLLFILLGILASHGVSILVSFMHLDNIWGSYSEVEQIVYQSSTAWIIVSTVIIAPILEEFIFRWLIFELCRRRLNFWISALISSVLFGIYHWNLVQGVYAFIVGMLFCYLNEKFHNITSTIVCHMAANGFMLLLNHFNLVYPATWIYVAVMVVCIAAVVLICVFKIRKITI